MLVGRVERALDIWAVCAPGQSDAAELVASVLLEKRNREGMLGRLMPRRETRVPRSDISDVVDGGCSRGDRGWFSMSSARPLAAATGSIRRRITRLNIVIVGGGQLLGFITVGFGCSNVRLELVSYRQADGVMTLSEGYSVFRKRLHSGVWSLLMLVVVVAGNKLRSSSGPSPVRPC